jgi:hypothetical protein
VKLKRETLATGRSPQELQLPLEEKARELELFPASQDKHNNWGPVYSNERYDLRIDKQPGREQYMLMLLYKAK